MEGDKDSIIKFLTEGGEKSLQLAASLVGEARAKEEIEERKLLSEEALKEKYTLEAQKAFTELNKKIEVGTKLLIQTLSEMAYEDRAIMTQDVIVDMSKIISLAYDMLRDEARAEDVAKSLFVENKGFQDICDMSDKTIETLYKAAKKIYDQKRFEDAVNAFSVLCILQTKSYPLWLGLANSQFFCERYDAAVFAYAYAATSDLFQPDPHLLSCTCYEKLNQLDLAINALDLSLIVMENHPEYKELMQQALAHKEALTEKLRIGG